jgi:VanZ family protein
MMSPLRYRRLWILLGFGSILAVGVASLVSINLNPLNLDIPLQDKLIHAVVYAALTAWFMQIYHGWPAWGVIMLSMLVLGLGLELLQGLTPSRAPEALDLLADGIGITFASIVAWTPLRYVLLKIEQVLP